MLRTLDILIHPFCPHTSEYLYQTVFDVKMKSILLDKWPQHQKSLVNEGIEEAFDIMKDVVSISSAARMKGKTKETMATKGGTNLCKKKDKKQN